MTSSSSSTPPTTNASTSAAQVLEVLLCGAILAYVTLYHQDEFVSSVVSTSTVSFGALYAFLKLTNLCCPPSSSSSNTSTNTSSSNTSPLSLSPYTRAEWRSRQCGTVHAILLTIGSIFCFCQWPKLTDMDMWTIDKASTYNMSNAHVPIIKIATLCCTFLGYLQYDLLWVIFHRRTYHDTSAMIHHVLYITMTHYLLGGETFDFCRPFAWLTFTELSTPFLHWRWFLLTTHQKHTSQYKMASVGFAMTFLLTRVLCYGIGIVDLWRPSHATFWRNEMHYGIYGVVLGIHAGFALNLFWARKVIKGLWKMVTSSSSSASSKNK